MRHSKLESELDLLLLLAENTTMTVEQICQRQQLSRRNFYYYLEFFRDAGFIVEKRGSVYSIDRDSPFFKKVIARISFTEDEAIVMNRLLNKTREDAIIRNLKNKLNRFYDLNTLNDPQLTEQQAAKVLALSNAIKYKQMTVLKSYASPHGGSQRDRLVEPFLLMNNNQEVRCYEPTSRMNKTFKLSRIGDVELLSDNWLYEQEHRQMYTDIFMFSGEESYPIDLRLGTLSYHILIEEYPQAESAITQEDTQHWRCHLEVCSYTGITRFVMGLYEDIEILGDDAFKDYISKTILNYYQRSQR